MGTILKPGRNCWRLVKADKVGFAIDGASYFGAFAESVARAQRSVMAVGWDMDSRMRLDGSVTEGGKHNLASFLQSTLGHQPELDIYLLSWDFAFIFALERELFPTFQSGWPIHPRFHFALDAKHPPGASHHQKIVVIDNRLAFVGGLDLTVRRFDTRDHTPNDPRRIDSAGHSYGPFHDVQVAVSGEAAEALGALVRRRWLQATGERVNAREAPATFWPTSLFPAAEHVLVAISRTEPAHNGSAEITEIRALYLDALAAAKRYIYIENQYFTAACLGETLLDILQRSDPPEIVVVLPNRITGWLQQRTMGVLRAHLIGRLRAADRRGRLRIYYPHMDGLGNEYIKVHSKILLVDDTFLTIGSANANNRSMGLDSECNVSMEAESGEAIRRLKEDLLAEHLGADREEIARRLRENPSLISLIESFADRPRNLRPLTELSDIEPGSVPDALIADPERPMDAHELVAGYIPEDVRRRARRRLLRNAILLVAIAIISTLWSHTPLHLWFNVPKLVHMLHSGSHFAAAPLIALLTFVVGGLVFFPVTLLIIATAVAFPPPASLLYALAGCMASASVNYGVGRILSERYIEKLGGARWQRLRDHLKNRGLMAMITIGLVPVAPFSMVTIGAGTLRVPYRNVIVGSTIGVTPGIVAIGLFTDTLTRTLATPGPAEVGALVGLVAAIVAFALWMRRWLAHHREKKRDIRNNKGSVTARK